MTKESMLAAVKQAQGELLSFVDSNTKGKSRAAANFSKKAAADIKAGMNDGVGTALATLANLRVFDAAEWAFRNGYVPPV